MAAKQTGRPRQYHDQDVLNAIEIVEQGGGDLATESVKKVMCLELGIPHGINAQTLGREIERLLALRERERLEILVSALPPTSLEAAKTIGAKAEAAALEQLAREHDALRRTANEKVVEQKDLVRLQRDKISELKRDVAEKDADIARLEEDVSDKEKRLEHALTEIKTLKDRIELLQSGKDSEERLLELVQRAWADRGRA